jgi:hypothetical protein
LAEISAKSPGFIAARKLFCFAAWIAFTGASKLIPE